MNKNSHCKPNDPNFDIMRHIIALIQEAPFYAMISQHVHKIVDDSVETAAMAYNLNNEEFTLYCSPTFFGGGTREIHRRDGTSYVRTFKPLSNWEIRNVLIHEFNHFVFGHLTARRRTPETPWGWATDCAINSLIKTANKQVVVGQHGPLPHGCLIPGEEIDTEPEVLALLNEEELTNLRFMSKFIAKLPPEQTSEFYMQEFMTHLYRDEGVGNGDCDGMFSGCDEHDMWDDMPEEIRERVEGMVKAIVKKAANHADSTATGWGNIPMNIREEIRRSTNNTIDWHSVLKQFTGTLQHGARSTSIKRINRKYPYVHPGLVKGHVARMLIAIDMSGSVNDEMLNMFFGALSKLSKKIDIDILPFDCSMSKDELFTWKRGTVPDLKRVRCGGTDFNVPTAFVNDVENRGRWDGLLIMTDGHAPKPDYSRIKRGWVLGEKCKLDFSIAELQIFMDKNTKMTGAWR